MIDNLEALRKIYAVYTAVATIAEDARDDGGDVTFDGVLFDILSSALDDFESAVPAAVLDQPLAFENFVAEVTGDYSRLAA